jgi:hypothetical protein
MDAGIFLALFLLLVAAMGGLVGAAVTMLLIFNAPPYRRPTANKEP